MSIAVPKTAMVLAAGHGTRMRPLTDALAKPMIPVLGKTLFDRAIDPLIAAGVERAVVNVCWCADDMEAMAKSRADIEIIISDERSGALETGGGLAKARPLLGDDPILVVNTDAFWSSGSPEPILALAERFDPAAADLCLLVAEKDRALGFPGPGDFFLHDDHTMTRRGEAAGAPYAYAGVRITKPGLYDGRAPEKFSALEIWDPVIAKSRLKGVVLDEFWLHVGTPDALADAEFWLRCHGERAPK